MIVLSIGAISAQDVDDAIASSNDTVIFGDSDYVSGGVDFVTVNPWNTTGELSYDIPSDATSIKSADVYVNVYGGSAKNNYGANANITITAGNSETTYFESLWTEEGSSDGTVYIVNDHTTKCYSDYMIHYDLTSMLDGLNGNNLKINVDTFEMEGMQFDGRIKLIALILAYDDGDDDSIGYWINDDQLWSKTNVTVTFGTEDVTHINGATLSNVVLSSGDGTYMVNDEYLGDADVHESGNYYQYNEWDVTKIIDANQNTDLNVIYAGTSAYGSIKNVLSVLTIDNSVFDNTVSGGVDVVAVNPWNTTGELSYDIPSDAKSIKSADVYVNVYAGSAKNTYGANADITIATDDADYQYSEYLWIEEGSSDGTVYTVNNHITKCYSDYMIHYDVTNKLRNLNGTNLRINVDTSEIENKSFDGRIKLIALVLTYDDGDDDFIGYWINDDQLWSKSNVTVTFDTEDILWLTEANLVNFVLSSGDGTYMMNDEFLGDADVHVSGNYFQYNEWDVTNLIEPTQKTDLNVIYAGTSAYGSIKNVLSVLTIDNSVFDNTVSGGVDVVAVNPWNTTGELSYDIPSDAKSIKSADVYVNVYAGSAKNTYGANADITITADDTEYQYSEYLWIEEGSSDGTVYVVNDYITKCYSDYMIHYDITNKLRNLNGTNLRINVDTSEIENKSFDGRIKLISLILAYDDGDDDVISYWINDDQLWSKTNVTVTFGTEDVTHINGATLSNVVLSSGDGTYMVNDEYLGDADVHESGNYYQYNEWDVTKIIDANQNTDLNVIYAGTSAYGSIKNVLSVLTIDNSVFDNTVSGGVDVVAVNPWNTTGELSYDIPSDAKSIKSADVYVNVYAGSAKNNYGANADISITADDTEYQYSEYLWIEEGSSDGTVYTVNNHVTKCYSDYMIHYDVTNKLRNLNGTNLRINVDTSEIENKSFDGRIKLISLILAYDDGDSDVISYWINDDQLWSKSNVTVTFDTADVTGINAATLDNFVLSSGDGTYMLNDEFLGDADVHVSGNYFQYNEWDVTDVVKANQINDLNVIYAGTSAYGSIKNVLSVLTIKSAINTDLSTSYDENTMKLVASLTNNVTGQPIKGATVRLTINDQKYSAKTNEDGQAEFSTANLAPGNYTGTVYYLGNSKYNPVSTTVDITVNKMATNISAAYDAVTGDLVATLINEVTGQPIKSATVRVTIDGQKYTVKTNASGQAKLEISDLAPGAYTATVSYNGNSKYDPASTAVDIIIPKITTSISLFYDGAAKELVAVLVNSETGSAISGGNVVFNLNGVKTTVKTDKQGEARFAVEGNSSTFNAAVSYGGNSKYYKSTASIKVIEDKMPTSISLDYDAENGEVVATLINVEAGKVITGANVVFSVKSVKTTVKTNRDGQAIFSIADLDSGIQSIAASYGGNSKYAGSTASIMFVKP